MKKFIIEKQMLNKKDGYYAVVVEGETHLNRTVIKSSLQFFTLEGGYDFCHPWGKAKAYAEAIAEGLNRSEQEKAQPKNNEATISEHTPGEWKSYQTEKGYSIESTSESGSLIPVATIHRFYKNSQANAKLIAAAPDLLEACKLFLEFDKQGGLDLRQKVFNAVDKAIKKATE